MTPVDKALLVSAEQILRLNGYEAEAGAVGRVGENLESAERDAGRWRTTATDCATNTKRKRAKLLLGLKCLEKTGSSIT